MKKSGKSGSELSQREIRGRAAMFLERNRGRAQYRSAPHASVATGKILRPLSKKFGPGVTSLKAEWGNVVGEKWASLSRPLKITGGRDGKTLHIEAKGPAAALMAANSGQLLAQINGFLGLGSVHKIRVKQGFTAKKPAGKPEKQLNELQETLETGEQDSLEQALNRLGVKLKSKSAPSTPAPNVK